MSLISITRKRRNRLIRLYILRPDEDGAIERKMSESRIRQIARIFNLSNP